MRSSIIAINSLRPSDTYMRQYNIPTLVQIMACRLFGAKPLSEPMLPYSQLDPKELISLKLYLKFRSFHSRKCTWKCHLRNGNYLALASLAIKAAILRWQNINWYDFDRVCVRGWDLFIPKSIKLKFWCNFCQTFPKSWECQSNNNMNKWAIVNVKLQSKLLWNEDCYDGDNMVNITPKRTT